MLGIARTALEDEGSISCGPGKTLVNDETSSSWETKCRFRGRRVVSDDLVFMVAEIYVGLLGR